MPSKDRSGLLNRFLEELAVSFDLQQTIKKLNIPEASARAMLKGLITGKKAAAHKDLFDEGVEGTGGVQPVSCEPVEKDAVAKGKKIVRAADTAKDAVAGGKTEKARRTGGAYVINVDGASRGNPGEAGAGAVIKDSEGGVVKRLKKYLGTTTNNMAEYQALVMALEAARSLKLESVRVLADSELMVKQMNGVYRVKSEDLKPLYEKARGLAGGFKSFKIVHVYREANKDADNLANEAIDGRKGA